MSLLQIFPGILAMTNDGHRVYILEATRNYRVSLQSRAQVAKI